MEAFAALGIACNILQLISCGLHIASVSKQIYEKGSTDRNDEVSEHAKQMALIAASLEGRLMVLSNQPGLTRDQRELQKLAISCKDVSAKLQHEIDRLGQVGQKRRWRAVPASIKTVMHQKAVDDLERRLQENRSILQTHLLADIHVQQEAVLLQQSQEYLGMERSFQDLVAKVAAGSASFSDLVIDVNLDLTQLIKSEGRDVRDHVTSQIQSLEVQAAQNRQREKLEQSLQYPEMNERMSSLTEAHASTFEWLFAHDQQGTWSSFTDWLENDNRIYWISGKPGSGKSVLMKYLLGHEKTDTYLSQWAETKPVLKIHFFIWKAGHTLQRRRKGLLASVVRQLIEQNDAFANEVLKRPNTSIKREIADWSTAELSDLLGLFTDMKIANLCIFVDGLDETDGADGDVGMLKLISWLCKLKGVKLCVASRAEPEFRIALAECPQLTLQDLTEGDLRVFIHDQLKEVGQQQFLDEEDPFSVPERLLGLVLAKADGVFLWVRLAITNITRGLQRMDGWEELTSRLDQLPSELEDLYIDMWQRNRDDFQSYRKEAAQYFQMVLADLDVPISSFEVMSAHGKHAKTLLAHPDSNISRDQLLRECERFEHRIITCSLGLLEIRSQKPRRYLLHERGTFLEYSLGDDDTTAKLSSHLTRFVCFIHRTAVEFLRETLIGQEIMQSGLSTCMSQDETHLNAHIIAQFGDFPIIDVDSSLQLFMMISMMETSDDAKIKYVETLNAMQTNPAMIGDQDEHFDVYRNYVDSVLAGKWIYPTPIESIIGNEEMCPAQYALGRLGMVARAVILPYFERFLSQAPRHMISQDFASCLAWCAAAHDQWLGQDKDVWSREIMSIKLINLAIAHGADIDAKFPLWFGKAPFMDALSRFCGVRYRTRLPDSDGVGILMRELKLALSNLSSDTRTTFRWLVFPLILGDGGQELDVRAFEAGEPVESTEPVIQCLVEMNFTAMLQLYCQSIRAPNSQIEELLKDRSTPKCTLLGVRKPMEAVTHVDEKTLIELRSPSSKADSDRFYAQADKCSRLVPFLLYARFNDEFRTAECVEASRELFVVLTEIFDRGTKTTPEDLIASTGYISSEEIMPADVPFLRPFEENKLDVSKLMHRD